MKDSRLDPRAYPDIPRKYGSINEWCAMTGMSRRFTYDKLAEGVLRAVKVGTRTLVDFEHGLGWLKSLPPAVFPALSKRKPKV